MPGRSPRDKTWTHAERDSTRFQRNRGKPVGRLDNPKPNELRQAIMDARCWWCDTEGWKSIANHIYQMHGITADEVREMAHLFKGVPLCSPEYSQERRIQVATLDSYRAFREADTGDHKVPRNMSEAGKEANRVKLKEYWESIGPVAAQEQRMAANRVATAKSRKPHKCFNPDCNNIIPRKWPQTCSNRCTQIVRWETVRKKKEMEVVNG